MRIFKRLLSLTLAVAVLSALTVSGFAANGTNLLIGNDMVPPIQLKYLPTSSTWSGHETIESFGNTDASPVITVSSSVTRLRLDAYAGPFVTCVVNYNDQDFSFDFGGNLEIGGSPFLSWIDISDLAPGGSAQMTMTMKQTDKTDRVYHVTLNKSNGDVPVLIVATPVITANPARPYVGDTAQVTMATATAEADIYYTLDGTEPSSASERYTLPLGLSSLAPDSITVKAIAVKAGLDPSRVTTKVITFREVSAPVTDTGDSDRTPSKNEANDPQTLQQLTGSASTVVPVKLLSGSASIGLELFDTLGSGSNKKSVEFTVSAGLAQPSATILVPGGFGKINDPGRFAYTMNYETKAPDETAMLAMVKKSEGAASVTALLGGNYKLPVAATVTVSVKLPEGKNVRILKYDPATGKLLYLGTATVKGGKLAFTTRDFGQLLFTTGNV